MNGRRGAISTKARSKGAFPENRQRSFATALIKARRGIVARSAKETKGERLQVVSAAQDYAQESRNDDIEDYAVKCVGRNKVSRSVCSDPAIKKMVKLMRLENKAAGTIGNYVSDIELECRRQGKRPIDIVAAMGNDAVALQEWFDNFDYGNMNQGDTDSTRNNKFCAFKKLFETNGLLQVGLVKKRVGMEKAVDIKAFEQADLQKMFSLCENTIQEIIVSLYAESSQRRQVYTKLKWKDVLSQMKAGEQYPYRYVERNETKRGIRHPMFFTPTQVKCMQKRLKELREKGIVVDPEWHILSHDKNPSKPLCADRISNIFRELSKRAGVNQVALETKRVRMWKGRMQEYRHVRYTKPPHSTRSFASVQMYDRDRNITLFEVIAGHKVDKNGYFRSDQIDKDKLRADFIKAHPRIFEDHSDLRECQVNKWLEDAKKLGIADSKICEIKKILTDGERPSDREASNDDHGQNRDETLEH